MHYIIENNNSSYYKEIDKIINVRKKEIFNFFQSKELDLTCDVYVYNSIESLVKGLKERGFKKNPDYMCACFKDEDNSLNFFEPKDKPNNDEWTKKEYKDVIFHEMIHAIVYLLFGTIPEWLNEGIAKYLDGTYGDIKWLLNNKINNNQIPKQEEIENEFGWHEYNSYDYAYLMVSYLIDSLGRDEFINLLRDKNRINIVKSSLLANAIKYYNDKFDVKVINNKRRG